MIHELVIFVVIYVCWKVIHFTMNIGKKANNNNYDVSLGSAVIELSDESEVKVNKNSYKTKTNSYANVSHKKVCGANNWFNFMQAQPPKNTRPLNEAKQRQTNSKFNSKKSKISFKQSNEDVIPSPACTNNKIATPIIRSRPVTNDKQFESTKESSFKVGISQSKTNLEKDDFKLNDPAITKAIAMDCEMVGVEVGVNNNMLARVSLVNVLGDCIYDKHVKPTEPIVDYRTAVSGIRPKDLINACEFKVVQKEVADILKGKILVGHALKNDLSVLYLSHPKRMMRDTSKFYKFREGRTPALKKLAKKYLGATIQEGEHSSVQDALATMQLYRMFRKEWEASLRNRPIKKVKQNTQDTMF